MQITEQMIIEEARAFIQPAARIRPEKPMAVPQKKIILAETGIEYTAAPITNRHDLERFCLRLNESECFEKFSIIAVNTRMSIPHHRQADLQLHERVLSQLICNLMLPTFFLPGFRKSGPFPLPLKTSQIGYIPRSLAKSDDSHITIPRLNNSCQISSLNFSNSFTGMGL